MSNQGIRDGFQGMFTVRIEDEDVGIVISKMCRCWKSSGECEKALPASYRYQIY